MLNVKKIPTKLRYFILFVGFASVLLKIVWKQLLISVNCCNIKLNKRYKTNIYNIQPSCNELESSYVSGEFVSGGFYSPTSCIPLNTIAIIVPFRNRGHQQDIFVLQITSFLLRQRCSFQILIVEQFDSLPFNRASLLNAGVVWLENNMKQISFSCYIFHDVDHVPLDNRNIYECNLTRPVHFSTAVDKWNYSIPYDGFFGGVVAFSPKQFQQINGFSNCFWGWGMITIFIY